MYRGSRAEITSRNGLASINGRIIGNVKRFISAGSPCRVRCSRDCRISDKTRGRSRRRFLSISRDDRSRASLGEVRSSLFPRYLSRDSRKMLPPSSRPPPRRGITSFPRRATARAADILREMTTFLFAEITEGETTKRIRRSGPILLSVPAGDSCTKGRYRTTRDP